MKKKILSVMTIGMLVGVMLAMSIALAKEFTDLDSTHWAYPYVNDLTEKNVINGYEDGSYRPNGMVTRAEFFKLMVCCDEKILASGEKMIEERGLKLERWYDKYIYTAYLFNLNAFIYQDGDFEEAISRTEMAGIINAFGIYEGLIENTPHFMTEEQEDEVKTCMIKVAKELGYAGNKNITLENFDEELFDKLTDYQIAQIMERVNEELDKTEYGADEDLVPLFEDTKDENVINILSINNVKKLGIIQGYEDGTFRPNNEMTRAEVAVVISNYLKVLAGGTL